MRQGKGDRQRVVPIPDAVYTALLAYLLERGGKRGALFRTEVRRRPLEAKDVGQAVKDAAERAGLEGKVTPKTLTPLLLFHGTRATSRRVRKIFSAGPPGFEHTQFLEVDGIYTNASSLVTPLSTSHLESLSDYRATLLIVAPDGRIAPSEVCGLLRAPQGG